MPVDDLPTVTATSTSPPASGADDGATLDLTASPAPGRPVSRVEAATRQTGDTILLAERTKELLRDGQAQLAERDGATLKGKTENVRLYAPEVSRRE